MGVCNCELNLTDINKLLLIILFVRYAFNLIEKLTSEGYSLTFIPKIVCGALSAAFCTFWLYPILDVIVYFFFCKFNSIVIFGVLSYNAFGILRYETFPGLIAEICQKELERQLRNIHSITSEIGTQVDQHLEPAPVGQVPSSFDSTEIDQHLLNPQPPVTEEIIHEDHRHGLPPARIHFIDDMFQGPSQGNSLESGDIILEDERYTPSLNDSELGDGIHLDEDEEDEPIAFRLRSNSSNRKKKKQVVYHKPKPRRKN